MGQVEGALDQYNRQAEFRREEQHLAEVVGRSVGLPGRALVPLYSLRQQEAATSLGDCSNE